jgi:ribosomal protein S18 acetylase RimI-like enzyme
MNAGFTLRQAAEPDVASFREVARRSIFELCDPWYSQEELRAWLGQYPAAAVYRRWLRTRMLVVAEQANRVIGFAQLDPERAAIEAMHVLPECARCGVGTGLARTIEELAARRGFSNISVEASVNAAAFYERCGYVSLGAARFICRNGRELDAVKLRKELPAYSPLRS